VLYPSLREAPSRSWDSLPSSRQSLSSSPPSSPSPHSFGSAPGGQLRVFPLQNLAFRLSAIETATRTLRNPRFAGYGLRRRRNRKRRPSPRLPRRCPALPPVEESPPRSIPAARSSFASAAVQCFRCAAASTSQTKVFLPRWTWKPYWRTLFNRYGIIALIGAVTYFLRICIDNNWIGFPVARSHRHLAWRGDAALEPLASAARYSYFSEASPGLGAAALYPRFGRACQYYKLFSLDAGFAAMIVITAGMTAVALGRSSQRIALLSLFGGFLTPVLRQRGQGRQVVLFHLSLNSRASLLAIEMRPTGARSPPFPSF